VTLFAGSAPVLTLAPMQDVTDGAFWTLIHRYGGADVYWTEYLRVSATSTPEKRILHDITSNITGRPVVAQMIGNDIDALVRTAKVLQHEPGVPGADRLSEVRRRRAAARAGADRPHPWRAA
jgi:tRNA-dihydrouridine synthase B